MFYRNGFRTVGLAAVGLAMVLMLPVQSHAQALQGPPPGTTQVPQPAQGGVNWEGAGYGAAALLGNLLYIPAKLVYAVTGGIVGGGSYLVTGGNKQISDTIWRSSLGGDYVLTPSMIEGKEPVYFSGPNQVAPAPEAISNSTGAVSTATSPTTVSPMASTSSPGITSSNLGSSRTGAASSGGALSSEPIDSGGGPVSGSHTASAPPLPSTSVE
jgi:hypothetical protein